MNDYISAELRRVVVGRAGHRCEYCLIQEEDTYFGCEVDHIVAIKHSGETRAENLAYTCQPCNRHKGTDLGSLSSKSGDLVRFYNPRIDSWSEHFKLENAMIIGQTEMGEVTVRILKFNSLDRLIEREGLIRMHRYP